MQITGRKAVWLLGVVLAARYAGFSQSTITPPKLGGSAVGDDYFLANYTQLVDYWHTLAKESDRITLENIGTTAEGRPFMMAIITSPENHAKLARYKEISERLARAEGLTDDQAHALASEGKAVVWIDGGLHATECINAQALFIEAYDLVSRNDPETLRILKDDILLLVPANPDGMELVSNWYMRESDPKKRNLAIPRLYQKYVGHDNNRDSYIANQPETEAINRQMYIEWIPQIMYNQHQTGPAGAVLFMSPFRDPFNYNQDPLVPIGIDLVGAAVHERFLAEGKPGAVLRNAAPYSTWFNGGDRTTTGFHNQIGLLSEIIGSPTPISIPLVASKLLADGNQPFPIGPRKEWHQRESIDYVITADYAILDVASKYREDFLYRIYRAGKNSIERGSQDHWTLTPKRVAELEAAWAKEKTEQAKRGPNPTAAGEGRGGGDEAAYGRAQTIPVKFWDELHTPETRDPRGYIIPADQPDFPTATKFVNALIKAGIEVNRATGDFTVGGKKYPRGSYVIKAAQAFRPHLRDMFEPQDHPNDFEYPGGPPKPPYDITGYTLAYQFGIKFDRILDGFDGPFESIAGLLKPAPGVVGRGTVGYLLSHSFNDSFTATNRLVSSGEQVYWLKSAYTENNRTYPPGTIYIPVRKSTRAQVEKLAAEYGLNFDAIEKRPHGDALELHPVRVGLWDRYGGSLDSGQIRWLLEQAFPTPYQLVFASELDRGDLNRNYDVLIFPGGAIPEQDPAARGASRTGAARGAASEPDAAAPEFRQMNPPDDLPDEYKSHVGRLTIAKTIPQLRKFVEEGGTILAIGSSTTIATHFGLPVTSALVETTNNVLKKLGPEKFYIPGSLLQADVDDTRPLAYGLPDKVDVFFENSPAFRLLPDAGLRGVYPVAWFSSPEPLRSGWAWGQQYLNGSVAVVEAKLGKGQVFLYGPQITFRAQPHGTFKFLFNGIYSARATPVKLP